MALVALRPIIGNNGRRYLPGEPVDEALTWRYPALKACLNLGLLKDETGEIDKLKGRVRVAPEPVEEPRELDFDEIDLASGEAPAAEPELLNETAAQEPEVPVEAKADAVAEIFNCTKCEEGFKTERLLKIHVGKAHRE